MLTGFLLYFIDLNNNINRHNLDSKYSKNHGNTYNVDSIHFKKYVNIYITNNDNVILLLDTSLI
jgi:hypothetical protein